MAAFRYVLAFYDMRKQLLLLLNASQTLLTVDCLPVNRRVTDFRLFLTTVIC